MILLPLLLLDCGLSFYTNMSGLDNVLLMGWFLLKAFYWNIQICWFNRLLTVMNRFSRKKETIFCDKHRKKRELRKEILVMRCVINWKYCHVSLMNGLHSHKSYNNRFLSFLHTFLMLAFRVNDMTVVWGHNS